MKKTTILATTGAVVLVAGLLIPSAAFADDSGSENTFLQRVAEKIGVSSDELETAMDEVKVEFKEERDAGIDEAYENGELTAKQYEILQAQQDLMSVVKENHEPGERPEKGDFIESLSELGVEVTEEELQELRETMESLGLKGQGPRGGRGLRMHR